MSRLVEPAPAATVAQGGGGGDDYLTRVAKYVPAEVVAAYLAGQSILAETALQPDVKKLVYVAFFGVLFICTPIYLSKKAQAGQPKRKHVVVGTVAFVFWVYALGSLPQLLGFYSGTVGGLLLIVFSLAGGLVVPVEGEK
jgi:hypothetical protein